MAHKFQAPKHVSGVFTSTGEHRADEKGVISLPADAPASDHNELRSAGCVLIGAGAAPKAPKAKSELGALRAEYKALAGKAPSPKLDADGLRAKIAELQAAAAPPSA
jgi:hypothetical protein